MQDQHAPDRVSRRKLFSILPAAAVCVCPAAARCPAAQSAEPAAPPWTAKTDLSWQDTFRLAYQKDYIPLMKGLAERIGKEKFLQMIEETNTDIVNRKMAGRSASFDFAKMTAGFHNPPPFIKNTLVSEVIEDKPQAFEYKVHQCLWAKTFRDSDASDLGYSIVCQPDFAIAHALSPKLKLTRSSTLMQGGECCHFRYEMQS